MQWRATNVMAFGIFALTASAFLAVAATAPEVAEPAPSTAEAVLLPRLPDREPPVILPLPVEPTLFGEPLVLRARVTDPSGVREVRLLAKGEGNLEYVPVPMVEVDKDLYAATLPPAPERGSSVSWLVEATDGLGNGPRRAGNPGAPFVAPLLTGGRASGASRRVALPYLAGLAAAVVAIPVAGAWRVRSRRRARANRARAGVPARDPRAVRISEDLFWLRLLTPLLDLSHDELRSALRELLSREHPHPVHGPSRFSRQEVLARIRWAQAVDPAAVLASWRELRGGAVSRSAGAPFVELLLVLTLMGLVAGTTAIYLKPMETSTRDGAKQVEGFFKESRFKAMATTSAYRVQAATSSRLFAETAASCSSTTWTADPALSLDLPRGVTLADTGWTLCFGSRGISSQNLTVTVLQAGRPTRIVEVLLGGTARIVP